MQAREKILLIVLVGVGGLWVLVPMIESWVFQPVVQLRQQRDNLESELVRLEERKNVLLAAARQLKTWNDRSLPPNPEVAQSVYQDWLVKLAELAGCSTPTVILEARVPQGDVYTSIPVRLTMRGTLEQLARFVALFESTNLAHTISFLDLKSPSFDGNPRFDLTIRCEGLAIHDAPPRTRLFPRTTLATDLSSSSRTITVTGSSEFADLKGQRIRIGTELLTVVDQQGETWTVERGTDGTLSSTAKAGEVVELMPRRPEIEGDPLAPWDVLLANSPFTKPEPPIEYRPRITSIPNQLVIQGDQWKYTLQAPGWDPEKGSPVFAFDSEVPEGLELDRSTGALTWQTDDQTPARDWTIRIRAVASRDPSITVTESFRISVRPFNIPPTISAPSRVTAYSGQPVSIPVSADDPDGDNRQLRLSITGGTARGVEIDSRRGLLNWTPPLELDLGGYTITVEARDSGDPAKTAATTINVQVEEDHAFFTRYVGILTIDGQPEAWFYDSSTGLERSVRLGETLQVSEIGGTVVAITRDRVVLRNEQELFEVTNGNTFRERRMLDPEAEASLLEGVARPQ